MKTIKKYIFAIAATMGAATALWSCQDDVDAPGINIPQAVNVANTTIAQLKADYWDDAANYAQTVGTKPDGSHYIIKGRVISSDEQSNVFKFLSIQDETAAITFSINSYNLYLNYRLGQEIVIDATGMHIGKYAGLQQFGTPSWYENGSTWQVGFMSPQFFQQHIELNGLPTPAQIDTLAVSSFSELDSSPEGLQKWQGQMVRFNNVHFLDGGVKTFSAYHSNDNNDVNRTLVDSEGNSNVVVRTSGYATFWNKTLPKDDGDVVGILSFYQNLSGASMWQLILNDYEGCMNFGNPTVAPGTENFPMQVAQAIELIENGTPKNAWVTGYIVGAVGIGVDQITSTDDIQWEAPFDMPYTLVIGADKETRSLDQLLIVELPAGTPFRQFGNLRDNPENLGREITLKGDLTKVLGTYGISGNTGATSQFKIDGVQTGAEGIPAGEGSQTAPYNPTQVVQMNPQSTTAATETGVWVKGYIVGYMPTDGSTTTLAGTVFGVSGTVPNTNLVIATTPDETDPSKCVGIQLVAASVTAGLRDALNLASHPENLGKKLAIKGDIMKYCGGPGVKNGSEWELDGAGTVTPPNPSNEAIFSESFVNGTLGQFSTTVETSGTWTGWRANPTTATVPCAIANSYNNSTNEAATAWMISPEINLTGATTASIKVEQAFGFYFPTVQEKFCTLNIREAGGAWQQLTLTQFPAKGTGNWTGWAENTIDISAFVGKTVEVGFKYENDGSQSIAWEIRNFSVIADAGSVNPGTDPNPPTPPTIGDEEATVLEFTNGSTAYEQTSSYSSTWTSTDGFWSFTAINNNKNGWDYIAAGWKTDATTPTIATQIASKNPITTLQATLLGSRYTKSAIKSVKLHVANNAAFTSATETDVTSTLPASAGETMTVPVNAPAGSYVKLVFSVDKMDANGQAIAFTKVALNYSVPDSSK